MGDRAAKLLAFKKAINKIRSESKAAKAPQPTEPDPDGDTPDSDDYDSKSIASKIVAPPKPATKVKHEHSSHTHHDHDHHDPGSKTLDSEVIWEAFKSRLDVNVEPVQPATEFEYEQDFAAGQKNRNIWGTWRRPLDFTLTLVGYTVGVHDFWRFPYLCYKYGGIFLIPYLLVTLIIAIPTSFMEFTIGQYFGVGATEAFGTMAPILTGISYLMAWNSVTTSWLYAMMITWSRLYSSDALSCRKGWETCDGRAYYNSRRCYTGRLDEACELAYFQSHRSDSEYSEAEKAEGVHDYLYFDFECIHLKEYCTAVYGNHWKALGGQKMCLNTRTGKRISSYKARVHACTEYFYGGVTGLKIRNETDHNNENKLEWTLNPISTSQTELREVTHTCRSHDYQCLPISEHFDAVSASTQQQQQAAQYYSVILLIHSIVLLRCERLSTRISKQYCALRPLNTQTFLVVFCADRIFGFYSATTFLVILIFLTEGFLSVSIITYLMNGAPFVMLGYFTVKALSLPHSVSGIEAFVTIGSWSTLKNPEVWVEAVIQTIGTSGIANGVLINLSSFNKAHHNFTFDLVFTTALNNICCLCTTIICFCTIGHYLEHYRINVPFQEYIEAGSVNSSIEFGYVVYSIFLSVIRDEKFSIIMFFTMITSFSIDSALRMIQNTLDVLTCVFPRLRKYRFGVLLGVSLVGIAAILPMTKNGGFGLFLEYEYYLLNFTWISILLVQTIGINWVYKTFRILDNAEQYGLVTTKTVRMYMTICQQYLTPLILAATLGHNLYFHEKVRFNQDQPIAYLVVLGFTFSFTPMVILLVSIVEQLLLNDRARWSWLLAPAATHRSDSHKLFVHRHSGICATNYGPMKKGSSIKTKADGRPEDADDGLSPEDRLKQQRANEIVRAFAMKWRFRQTKKEGAKPTLRAELIPNPDILHLIEDDDHEINADEFFADVGKEGDFIKRVFIKTLEDMDHYNEWPGPLESDEERPDSNKSTSSED